jgi:DNA-binding CsgD family transcriptional regulator
MSYGVLSESDLTNLQGILQRLPLCPGWEHLDAILDDCRDLIGARYCLVAHSEIQQVTSFSKIRLLNNSYPEEWMLQYQSEGFQAIDPVVTGLLSSWQQQRWSDLRNLSAESKRFVDMAGSFGLAHGTTHGMPCRNRPGHSLISFADERNSFGKRELLLVELLVGPLHSSIETVLAQTPRELSIALTTQERNVLSWLAEGKSSWEISRLLRISERTVKFHLKNLYQKLKVTNRAQAVAVAAQHGFLMLR